MCFVIVNHAKLCIFNWVLMCFKVIIEDQVKNTKFTQEKLKKSPKKKKKKTFLAYFEINLND